MAIDFEQFVKRNLPERVLYAGGEGYHFRRDSAIVIAYDLENALSDLLKALLRYLNRDFDEGMAYGELFAQDKPWDGLRGQVKIAFHFGLITKNERDDLNNLAKLRHNYAHDGALGDLSAEPKMQKFVHDCHVYRQNHKTLEDVPSEAKAHVTVCSIRDYYVATFKHRSEQLDAVRGDGYGPLGVRPGEDAW